MQNEYLEVLNLSPGATKKEIKSAFRRLSKIYHPDINKSEDAVEKFLEIHEAYKFLTEVGPKPNAERVSYDYDPRRAAYDDWRKSAREYAARKAREVRRQQDLQLRLILKYFNYYAVFYFIFNFLIAIDYFLPEKQFVDRVVSAHSWSFSNDGAVVDIKKSLELENFNMNLNYKATKKLNNVQQAVVVTTYLFQTPRYAIFEVKQQKVKLGQIYGLYEVFGYLIPASLIVLGLYFYIIDNPDHRISLALLLILFSSIQLFLFFKY